MSKETNALPFRRSASRKIWSTLIMLLIFICGGLVGGSVTLWIVFTRTHDAIHSTSKVPERFTGRLTRMLDLNDEQSRQVSAIVRDNMAELRPLRAEVISRLRSQMEKARHELAAVLTPKQKEKLDNKLNRIEKRWFAEESAGKQLGNKDNNVKEEIP
nr:hypothetical protein [uncultured Desulfobacter sp.]